MFGVYESDGENDEEEIALFERVRLRSAVEEYVGVFGRGRVRLRVNPIGGFFWSL